MDDDASSPGFVRCCERMRLDAGLLQQRCTEMPAAVQLTGAGALGL